VYAYAGWIRGRCHGKAISASKETSRKVAPNWIPKAPDGPCCDLPAEAETRRDGSENDVGLTRCCGLKEAFRESSGWGHRRIYPIARRKEGWGGTLSSEKRNNNSSDAPFLVLLQTPLEPALNLPVARANERAGLIGSMIVPGMKP
jgi:hypothetical protein